MIKNQQRNVATVGSFESMWEFYSILPKEWSNADIVIAARKKLSLSRATTYRYIKHLEQRELIEKVCRGRRRLSNNEKVIKMRKKITLSSLNGEIGEGKSFVKKRH